MHLVLPLVRSTSVMRLALLVRCRTVVRSASVMQLALLVPSASPVRCRTLVHPAPRRGSASLVSPDKGLGAIPARSRSRLVPAEQRLACCDEPGEVHAPRAIGSGPMGGDSSRTMARYLGATLKHNR